MASKSGFPVKLKCQLSTPTPLSTVDCRLSTVDSVRYRALSRYFRNSPSVDNIRMVFSSSDVR
jgi:hypothetical protein